MSHEEWYEDVSEMHPYGDGYAMERGVIWHEVCNECGEDMDENRICNDICNKCFEKLVTLENCITVGSDRYLMQDTKSKYNAFLEWMLEKEEVVEMMTEMLKEAIESEKAAGYTTTEDYMMEWAAFTDPELFVEIVG